MKNLLLIAITMFSVSVFANTHLPIVTDISTSQFIDTGDCQLCLGGKLVTETTFTFVDQWCATPDVDSAYEIVISEKPFGFPGEIQKTVSVVQKEMVVDCMGGTREYTFQLSTDELNGDGYILLNPTTIKK